MDQYKVNLTGAVSWSFEFEDQEWFAGFRELATHGIDKPVLNVFRMFGMMNGSRISVKSDNGLSATEIIAKGVRERNDIHAIASRNSNSVCIMVWNYHDDDVTGPSSSVELDVTGIGKNEVLLHHYRVDQQFSNSFEAWKAMGKPGQVTNEQYRALEEAGQLQLYNSPEWKKANNGELILKFDLPRQGVSFNRITW
jgi:xylan 1,4-beta-xylosidase